MLTKRKKQPKILMPRTRRSFLTTVAGGFFGGALFGFSLPRLTSSTSAVSTELDPKGLEELVQRLRKLPPPQLALFGPDLVQLSFILPESEALKKALETLVDHLGELPPQQGRDLASLLLPGLDRIGRRDLNRKALQFSRTPTSPNKEEN
ncbi:MAG TPA: hypothetical protein ENK02_13505 [Planctomycetes bacterium]|nr:hypothetical protein [Planctomycetota bacterium]